MAATNNLSTLHPHLDDVIAKFVHQPQYSFSIQYVSYGGDTSPYTGQVLTNGYLIVRGSVEIAKGATMEINQDISIMTNDDLNSLLNFFKDDSQNFMFLKREYDTVTMKIGDCSTMAFDLNDHPWITDLVKLFQQVAHIYKTSS